MAASSSTSVRRTEKRAHHTWRSRAAPRSHFEDFLREIGASSQAHQLCCVPHQGLKIEHRATAHEAQKSTPSRKTVGGVPRESSHRRPSTKAQSPNGHHVRKETSPSIGTPSSSGRTSKLSIAPAFRNSVYPESLKVGPISTVDSYHYEAAISSSPVDSAQMSLRSLLGQAIDQMPMPPTPHHVNTHSRFASSIAAAPVPAASPSRSVSRSPSRDSLSTASSSEAPATPKTQSSVLVQEVRPTLIDLEQASRFRVQAICVTCGKNGANFPSCSRCGEMWCSRDCRLKGNNGARHVCRRRNVDTQMPSLSHDL